MFFFNEPPPSEIYTLSLHDALPIFDVGSAGEGARPALSRAALRHARPRRHGGAGRRLHAEPARGGRARVVEGARDRAHALDRAVHGRHDRPDAGALVARAAPEPEPV